MLTLLKDKVGDRHQALMSQMLERLNPTAQLEKMVTVMVEFDGLRESVIASASAQTPFSALQQLNLPVEIKTYPFGVLVESVAGFTNSTARAWIYFVNNQAGQVAADQHQLTAGDTVQWRFTKPE